MCECFLRVSSYENVLYLKLSKLLDLFKIKTLVLSLCPFQRIKQYFSLTLFPRYSRTSEFAYLSKYTNIQITQIQQS